MTTENDRPAADEPEDMLARAAAEGPIAGIPRHETDEPEDEGTPIGLSSDDEGKDLTGFGLRGGPSG